MLGCPQHCIWARQWVQVEESGQWTCIKTWAPHLKNRRSMNALSLIDHGIRSIVVHGDSCYSGKILSRTIRDGNKFQKCVLEKSVPSDLRSIELNRTHLPSAILLRIAILFHWHPGWSIDKCRHLRFGRCWSRLRPHSSSDCSLSRGSEPVGENGWGDHLWAMWWDRSISVAALGLKEVVRKPPIMFGGTR